MDALEHKLIIQALAPVERPLLALDPLDTRGCVLTVTMAMTRAHKYQTLTHTGPG